MSITITTASEIHLDKLCDLNNQVQEIHIKIAPHRFKQTNQADLKKWFIDFMDKENHFVFVAKRDLEVVGYTTLIFYNLEASLFCHPMKLAYIDHICVDKQWRGEGVAKQLISFVKDKAIACGYDRIEISNWNLNTKAAAFFQSQCFEVFSERRFLNV